MKEVEAMAYMIRRNDKPDSDILSEYLLRSTADVASLPTSTEPGWDGTKRLDPCYPGSVAYTPDLANIYVLGPDDKWHAV